MDNEFTSNVSLPQALPAIAIPADPPDYKWKVLSTVIFGIFMIIMDTTVVNVAFPTIRAEFGGSLNTTQWVISIYVLVLGITTPLAGYLSDRIGAKQIYLFGLGTFAVGSLLCGLAPNLGLLIAARALQGIGGGIAMPLGMALLLQAFPPKEQGAALGIFGIAALVAPAVGPIVSGWLVDKSLWRVIFFINPPIGLLGVLLGLRFLRQRPGEKHASLDLAGILTEIVGFGAILYAASIAADNGWAAPSTLVWFGIGAAGLAAFAVVELRLAKAPLMDMRLFGNRVFLNASLMGYVSTVALFGAEFLMPIYLQSLRGRTALQTGLILLPMAIAGGIFVTLSGRIYDRVGPRPLLVTGFALLVVNTWQLGQIRADTGIAWIVFLLILRGLALGMTVQTTLVTALSVVPRRELPRGSSLTNATRLVVQSIGVAVLATVLASSLSPASQALQDQFENASLVAGKSFGLCEVASIPTNGLQGITAGVKVTSLTAPVGLLQGSAPQKDLLAHACQESITGFERAYRVTFVAALIALFLGMLLPGWPGKWEGRG